MNKYRWHTTKSATGERFHLITRQELVATIYQLSSKPGWWAVAVGNRYDDSSYKTDGFPGNPDAICVWSRRCEAKRQAELLISQKRTVAEEIADVRKELEETREAASFAALFRHATQTARLIQLHTTQVQRAAADLGMTAP
jgi:hypothetical protein